MQNLVKARIIKNNEIILTKGLTKCYCFLIIKDEEASYPKKKAFKIIIK